jgi:hypothetical protein
MKGTRRMIVRCVSASIPIMRGDRRFDFALTKWDGAPQYLTGGSRASYEAHRHPRQGCSSQLWSSPEIQLPNAVRGEEPVIDDTDVAVVG